MITLVSQMVNVVLATVITIMVNGHSEYVKLNLAQYNVNQTMITVVNQIQNAVQATVIKIMDNGHLEFAKLVVDL
jgi:hypothetical protein